MINIYQNRINEKINTNVISALYNQSKKNEGDANSNLYGSVSSNYGYRSQVNYLNNRFNNFDVNILTDYYVEFKDPYLKQFWAHCPIGDGFGVLETEYAKLSSLFADKNTKYGYTANPNYFGTHRDAVLYDNYSDLDKPVQRNILAQVTEFPELIDFPCDGVSGFYTPMLYSMLNLKAIYFPKVTTGDVLDYGNYPNLEVLSYEYTTNFVGPELACPTGGAPKLKKIVAAPSQTYIKHGTLVSTTQVTAGAQIFMYANSLDSVNPDCSTWTLNGLRNAIIWVQDSLVNAWRNHKQISRLDSSYLTVKPFSEYPGNDLVTRWIMT